MRRHLARVSTVLVFLAALLLLLASVPGREHFLADDDHGFQLCLGYQVLHGKTPGVDVFNAYGPLVVYASAWARMLSGSLVGESLLCSVAWALALTLVFALVRRHASPLAALAASAAAFLLLARYYKWYLWLWPLAALLALDRLLAVPGATGGERRSARRRALGLGLVLGLGWLHRIDVGTLGVLACGLVLALHGRRHLVPAALGAALPVLAWFGYLLAHTGVGGAWHFVHSTVAGGWMAKTGMGTAWPVFDPADPLGRASSRVLAYGLLAAAIVGWSVAHLVALRRARATPRSRFLFACACLTAASLHQALHRRDGQHLLQVLAPALAGAFVWAEALLRGLRGPTALPRPRAVPGLALLSVALLCGYGLADFGRVDLVAPRLEWEGRWRRLADPLRGSKHPLLRPLEAVRRLSGPGDSLLVFPLWPQAYVFAERRLSGMLHGYYPGVFDRPPWSEENLRAVRADPPALVLVTADFLGREGPRAQRNARFRAAHAELDRYLHETYTRVLFDDGNLILLGPR